MKNTFNQASWISLIFLLSDTQQWINTLVSDTMQQVPITKRERLFRKNYYLGVNAMAHIIERHYCELPTYPGSGRFLLSIPELLTCIRDAYYIRPEPLHDTGNARRVVQLEKAVGFNRQFEATDKLTVITDSGGRILTAFPGDDL